MRFDLIKFGARSETGFPGARIFMPLGKAKSAEQIENSQSVARSDQSRVFVLKTHTVQINFFQPEYPPSEHPFSSRFSGLAGTYRWK